ncbi:MAG: hypothetical protein ACR2P0_15915 [Acidimicrobiales bacterium]
MSNPTINDLFASFGLEPNASSHKINAAFRALSKRAHPDAGGSRDHFEKLQSTREILLGASRGDAGTSTTNASEATDYKVDRRTEPRPPITMPTERPIWLPGAVLAIPVAVVVGAFALIRLDRTLIAAALGAALAVWFVTTVILALRSQHANNTKPEVIYRPAEEIIQMRAARIRAEQQRARQKTEV